jgi:uncharacterized protein (DUF4415 family)
MSATRLKTKSKTDWKHLASKSDRDIDLSDIPELGPDFWRKATLRMPEIKESVTIRVDREVLQWFRSQGRGYQTKMNAVLRSYVQTINAA